MVPPAIRLEKGFVPYWGDWLSAGMNGERADITLSHVDAGMVHATGVSLRGYGHLRDRLPLQDAHALGVAPDSTLLIALVADGSGKVPHSHWLSEALVRTGWRHVANRLRGHRALPDAPGLLAGELRALALAEGQRLCAELAGAGAPSATGPAVIDHAAVVATPTAPPLADGPTLHQVAAHMACTLQFLVFDTESLDFVWVDVAGDGSAYWRGHDGRVHVIHQGSDATGTYRWSPPLPSYTGEPLVYTGRLDAGEMLFMVTDGIGEAILDGTTPEAIAFSSRLTTRPTVFNIAQFVTTVGLSDKDDKTLILITT